MCIFVHIKVTEKRLKVINARKSTKIEVLFITVSLRVYYLIWTILKNLKKLKNHVFYKKSGILKTVWKKS